MYIAVFFRPVFKIMTEAVRLAPKGHALKHTEAKEPTCTEEGNIEYWQCSEGEAPLW